MNKKIHEKFVKLCLRSSNTAQNSFHFDEIFFQLSLRFFSAISNSNNSVRFSDSFKFAIAN
eukprot:02112.XXX_26748_26930_1 [CDS] Oithona nana genome sequencing.